MTCPAAESDRVRPVPKELLQTAAVQGTLADFSAFCCLQCCPAHELDAALRYAFHSFPFFQKSISQSAEMLPTCQIFLVVSKTASVESYTLFMLLLGTVKDRIRNPVVLFAFFGVSFCACCVVCLCCCCFTRPKLKPKPLNRKP